MAAGRIRDEDVALVRERANVADVVSEHVTLRPGGGSNLKGLCPFHDEKTPSFTVAAGRNVYFCHGCGKGGDAITFIMEIDHLRFSEAVEKLASKVGIQLRYIEGGSAPIQQNQGLRQRLIAAHAAAAEFYAEQLLTPGARMAREFLAQRGFDREAAERYGCGFAPDAWDQLTKHLRQRGFTAQEIETGGLAKPARSGSMIDRFRRRLLWPIKDSSGDVIGFGARKLFEDDDGPKYLNTPESPLYKKSHVLYGIDQARREIGKRGQAVIVEGYTDVMACHLAGVPTAVATCGTAFGSDHISVLRRMLMDTDTFSGEIIFTFDGDAAGQKAALRAFADDQRFVAQTFIAVGPDGMDPCELRLAKGDLAVRDLVASRERLVAFALRTTLAKFDLDSPEGRIGGLRATAPLVAQIKDRSLRPEYGRLLAGRLGMEVEVVQRAVTDATKGGPAEGQRPQPATRPDDPMLLVEREALKLAIQAPALAGPLFDNTEVECYTDPVHIAVREAIAAVGGAARGAAGPVWIDAIRTECNDLAAQSMVMQLAVEQVRYDGEPDPHYVNVTVARLQLAAVNRRVATLKSKLQRVNPVSQKDDYFALFSELVSLEATARALKETAVGGAW
ncbi:DNA primase [Allocatelliglobosispora scoriae]|uniref:DNA primase n=1 Tax=Allocatelliglobosispora scoriae TaxID=643052 RepID=A0A841BSI2_9ACTN|nr:DNA primase [Allocatelliglobosispora scoriae]MBB5869692.1 DNA primase [Allocatelliglobosispora scoriae]